MIVNDIQSNRTFVLKVTLQLYKKHAYTVYYNLIFVL